jgi:lysophospholipase L1-like esterase
MLEAAVLLIAVLAIAAGVTQTRRRALPSRVLLVGDSHAEGLEPPLRELARARGIELDALAVRGSSARDWRREHLARALERSPAKLVLLVLGTNDCASPTLEAEFFGNVRTLVQRIRTAGRSVILLVSPALCERGRRALELVGADAFTPPALELRDGVHATPEGYGRWAASILAQF